MTESSKSILRMVTTGSVDDGKSTLIGRLLYEIGCIPEDQYAAIKKTSEKMGLSEVDFSLLLDGLAAEREQMITIDVAYRYFSTLKRKFIIADCPGHEQYTRNMITGASTADLAIILIDARKGVLTQSRRHSFLAALLQIPHLVVAVNKMDLVDYRESVFTDIVAEYTRFSKKLDIHDVVFIPVSAVSGDNVAVRSPKMPWYQGNTLLHHLENVHVAADRNLVDFRFPVQSVIRPNLDFRGFAGKVASGTIRPGEEIVVLPSGKTSAIKSLLTSDGQLNEAFAGQSVVMTLSSEIDISRGDMIVRKNNIPMVSNEFEAMLCWMDEQPLDRTKQYLLKHTTRMLKATVADLFYRIDVNTLHREAVPTLGPNEIGRVRMHCTQPAFFDNYRINRGTGSFILIDPITNRTAAAGMIRGLPLDRDSLADKKGSEIRRSLSSNTSWQGLNITREQREQRNGHKAAVIWLTGYSGAGKSTIGTALEKALFGQGVRTMLLDGDHVRQGLCGDLGFSDADRNENIRRVSEVVRLFVENGTITIATFISPLRQQRGFMRSLVPQGCFFETFVRCNLEVCKRRDPKGLYKKALAGEIKEFTGISAPYEEPQDPEIVVDSDLMTVEQIVMAILERLKSEKIIPGVPLMA